MMRVTVELISANTGKTTQLAQMHIANTGEITKPTRGNYFGQVFRGRKTSDFARLTVQKEGEVRDFPRQQLHVWNLVARMLTNMGYK